MPFEEGERPRGRSVWDTIALVVAAIIVVFLTLGLGGAAVFVFVMDKPDHARWTTAQSEMAETVKALHDYALKHGGVYPAILAGVAPAFPKGIPLDPFSKSDYVYKRTKDGFTLTCLGKDLAPGGTEIPERDIIFDETGQREP
jgi:hypothetical protein